MNVLLCAALIALAACGGEREARGVLQDRFPGYGSPPIPSPREKLPGPEYGGDTALLPR